MLRNREPNENDLRSARRTLGLLWKEHLANRLPYFELDTEARSYVYGLSDKGVKLFGGKTFDEHSERTLDHELEISFFHIALKQMSGRNGLTLYWQQSELKRGIHPDALFALTNAKGTFYFFLEIEKSKIGNIKNGEPSIIRKLARYAGYYDSDQGQKDWNFRKFRVIIVQRTDARRQNLLKALQEKFSHRMFWLATEPAYKEAIGAEIFLTPKDHSEKTYSFLDV